MSIFDVGDVVRVKAAALDLYHTDVAKKLRDRSGVVQGYTWPSGAELIVTWGKRGNRGKEFRGRVRVDDVELA